ncbi:MAG: T9SS type A sorting domain-containing protein [Lentimicrobiaceae bacterium]|nr:T9SS type A sorting domain-containing protein [Lentimicrobiaceae bacterium]
MKIYVDGTPITPWMDLNHTSSTLKPDDKKDLIITFGADDIVEKCEKKAKLYFHSTDFYKEKTILDVTVNFLVGIDELTVSDIKVYPNPTTGELRVTSYELPVTWIEVFDIYGRKQNAESRMQKAEKEIVMDIRNLLSGVYLLKIFTEAGVVVNFPLS